MRKGSSRFTPDEVERYYALLSDSSTAERHIDLAAADAIEGHDRFPLIVQPVRPRVDYGRTLEQIERDRRDAEWRADAMGYR